ncbi:hypothetical protein SEVIR_9G325000v4 [Setaria viridis]|uniref:non-specific serine/threonine protein kinase n=1 Tax=Setaria viridis TaxID=4556 RepID=A0A4U6T1L1_SETVI|nr:probable serine/threonine-protein kinase cdc7 isoform X2 [Setaria viridis]TKV94881.1 hypothetical protein SEVIR_9G325000v2 [Setaria viridis]
MAPDGAAAALSVEMELAWHLLTVLVRLGRPVAASDLATAASAAALTAAASASTSAAALSVSPDLVERMCRIPGSPLRISGGGVVTASETAVLAFMRFAGLDVPAPRVLLRPPEVRKWSGEVTIRYERKRKVSDVSCFSTKRHRLLAPDSDLMEHSEQESNQLVAQTCAPAATGEVHLEVMQELQDRLPTISTFIGEPSLGLPTGATLVPNDAKITTLCLQPELAQSLKGDDGTVLGNMALTLVPTNLSDCCSVNLPPLDAEKSKNIDAEVDGKSSRIGESEQAAFLNCTVEDSDDLQKESVHPTTIHAVVAGETENHAGERENQAEDLNLVCKNPGSPINYNTKRDDSIEAFDTIPNQADALQYNCPDAGHHENLPTCGQEKNPLCANACAEVCKDKTTQILFQPPMDTKAAPIASQMNRNSEPEALPQEATRYDCMDMRDLNIIAENRESKYLNNGKQPWNEVEANVSKNGQDRMVAKQNEKTKKNALPKEDKDRFAAKAQKSHVVPKQLPSFKGFVIEEEEGSGGYGTVYRALRKKDGRIFAIKCPHPNAHPHHVNNELKMLERFGGKHCVIKYECSLKSGELECFVLEHVEHDRPEILKKEIALLELQWYGYCLFRALASLHRQGVVHRDVKPGNFLFCRKLKKGYLIDFNLANDLHQKFLKNSKSETISCGKDTASQTLSKFAPVVHAKEAVDDSKQPLPLKRKRSSKNPVDSAPKIDNKSTQAADVSGVTSAKDPTSTKTSLDRLKQPMPYKGRKELMNFLHEAMQSPNKNTVPAPASQRKRVAAPIGSVDRKLFMLTPMPLHSGGSAVAGSGTFNNKGHGKHRREGPCVGTKGFRAPEVLFRSFHQGCKVDVWSAGVTLLYLIIGRTPFGGDPEQNIKEIAKLKGSEELWEVAKVHNCESSFPSDLFDFKSFHSVDLRQWCTANTRRPEFLKLIPESFFDLLDKCLAVNPRCRLTSEDALKHDFFSPCRDSFRKPKMLRISAGSDAASSSSPQNIALTAKQS